MTEEKEYIFDKEKFKKGLTSFFELQKEALNDIEDQFKDNPVFHLLNAKEAGNKMFLEVSRGEPLDQDKVNIVIMGSFMFLKAIDSEFETKFNEFVEKAENTEFQPVNGLGGVIFGYLRLENEINLVYMGDTESIEYVTIFNFVYEYLTVIFQILEMEEQQKSEEVESKE